MNQKLKKVIALVLLITISIVPALHKLNSTIPPEWFLKKFSGSILDIFPFGLEISFLIILAFELIAPAIMLIALIKLFLNKSYFNTLSIGFLLYYTLFLILTFGSFLVEDYSNAFKDFIYFVGLVVIENLVFLNKKRASNEVLD